MTFEMKRLSVEGEHELGTDTLTIRDGKIVAQSFAAKIVRKDLRRGCSTDFNGAPL